MVYHMYGNFGRQINGTGSSQYTSINEVVQAYNDGKITYSQACRILEIDFGQSYNDCRDILIIENPGAKPDCGVGKIAQFNTGTDRWECVTDPNYNPSSSENNEEKPSWWDSLTADQKYFYMGLLVIGVLYFVVWRDE